VKKAHKHYHCGRITLSRKRILIFLLVRLLLLLLLLAIPFSS
jgi:hypothetical protein